MGRDRRGQDDVSFALSSRSWGGGYMFRSFLLSILLFSSSLLLTVLVIILIISFFVIINNGQFGVGLDRIDAVANRNTGQGRGGNGYVSCYFCSLFYSFLLLVLLRFQLPTVR